MNPVPIYFGAGFSSLRGFIKMKCPHCGINFHDNWEKRNMYRDDAQTRWNYSTAICPSCKKVTVAIMPDTGPGRMVEPISASHGPISQHVPNDIASDYVEACNVLPISPKASAALSRRCLQQILNAFGYKAKDLAKQVDALLNETDSKKALPLGLYDTVDAVRNFGNFSAHPINEQTTLQIVEVEPEEAEWCLEIIEEMFEHFYERPALAASKKAALNAKLAAAGKPQAK
ncbi:phage FluMu protein Com [Agrobacterium vitis]|nr:phage FluMu protein Com [Agrobacterium vitis]MBE1437644.1 phage FluMu protein Com [Agrobacterium vitis]